MVDTENTGSEGRMTDGDDPNTSLPDSPLLDLLDTLVNDLGRVAAAEALGVNYRTLVTCYDSRRVSLRMRRALEEYRDADGGDGDEPDDESAGDIAEQVVSLEQRVVALEEERRALRETVEAQAEQLAQLERQVSALENKRRQRDKADAVGDDDDQCRGWRPPPRDHGLPDAGVVTLEEQPDEEHAFGPAVALVAEWRGLRTADGTTGSRIDRAAAAVRRWELEVAMLGDFGLTLPPGTEPLDASRREDHLRWRREALAAARRELSKAKGLRWLRRTLTLGVWWR